MTIRFNAPHFQCGRQAPLGVRSYLNQLGSLNGRLYSTSHEADLVVIGSGPGGYVAAIKASQLGLKVRSGSNRWQIDASALITIPDSPARRPSAWRRRPRWAAPA